jgi:sugar lactone lactonase YvrE
MTRFRGQFERTYAVSSDARPVRNGTKLVVVALLVLATACTALGAEVQRVRLVGARTAVADAPWRATLEVRPAPRVAPRVVASAGRATVNIRVRKAAAGRYQLNAAFPNPGRWRISARVGTSRHALGAIAVSAAPIRLLSVLGIALHPDGSLLIADGDSRRVVRADLGSGRLTTFASAGLVAPTGVAVGRDGTVYVADRLASAVFRVATGTVTRFAQYGEPLHVAVDSQGTVFVTGRENTVVRVDAATGATRRYAGTGVAGSSGNGGPALVATLATPHGIAVDPGGNVVITEDASVRRIDQVTNVIDAIAGTGTARRLCGEQGPPLRMCMTAIRIAFEPDGDFYVADPENSRLWRVAGGEARAFDLGFAPFDVVVESTTTVLVADSLNRRVVRYNVSTGAITKVVG